MMVAKRTVARGATTVANNNSTQFERLPVSRQYSIRQLYTDCPLTCYTANRSVADLLEQAHLLLILGCYDPPQNQIH